jgi:hypothetical protein
MWVVIHMCMEATLGISLCNCFYLKLAKCCFSYYLLCLLFSEIGEEEGGTGSPRSRGQGEMAQIIYTHVSKCKMIK